MHVRRRNCARPHHSVVPLPDVRLRLRRPRLHLERAPVVAAGASSIAAAFNTPLTRAVSAGGLSHSREAQLRFGAYRVILAGITTLVLMGIFRFFGHTSAVFDFGCGARSPYSALARRFFGAWQRGAC